MKVNEIFYSIQGEGRFTGTPAIFIRFSGCNLKCDFCDTEHVSGKEMGVEEIVQEVLKYPAKHIVITGGEPGLQLAPQLVSALLGQGKFIQVETNGTMSISGVDWVTCSPKYKPVIISHIDELKVVYQGQDMSVYDNIKAKEYYLQPCSGHNTNEVINYIKENPKWKLSLQIHKILNVQ